MSHTLVSSTVNSCIASTVAPAGPPPLPLGCSSCQSPQDKARPPPLDWQLLLHSAQAAPTLGIHTHCTAMSVHVSAPPTSSAAHPAAAHNRMRHAHTMSGALDCLFQQQPQTQPLRAAEEPVKLSHAAVTCCFCPPFSNPLPSPLPPFVPCRGASRFGP
jgi:hypothetical protein